MYVDGTSLQIATLFSHANSGHSDPKIYHPYTYTYKLPVECCLHIALSNVVLVDVTLLLSRRDFTDNGYRDVLRFS